MTLISDLDAAIDQHYQEIGERRNELKIFGRVWNLIPTLTTAQLNPLAQIQAAAEVLNKKQSAENQAMAFQFMAMVPETLGSVIREDEREEFMVEVARVGIPVAVITNVVEAIYMVYDASPLHSGDAPVTPDTSPIPVPQLVSTIDSGNSHTDVGQQSSPASGQLQSVTPNGHGTQPRLVVPTPQTDQNLQPYEAQIPPSVATPIE